MTDGYLFHCILVLSSLDQVDGPKSPFANQITYLKPTNEFIAFTLLKLLKVAHLIEIRLNLLQALNGSLFIEHLE